MIKFFSFFILFIWFLFPCNSFALNLDEAADQVAEYFQKSAIKLPDKKSIYIQVLNQFSLKKDSSAKKIETEIYLAMQRRFTGYRLFLDSNQDAAAVMISGMYEPRGNAIHLTLKAFDRNNQNEILGQTEVDFIMDIKVSKKLVAVLDLEAKNLSETQIKAFSDVFRSALFRKKAFNLVASAEIDKFDPDEIQNKTGCTSDQCALIIGEQLGVDRVISTSMRKVSDGLYILSGKIINSKDGSIYAATTIKHNGRLITLDSALETLAVKLTSDKVEVQAITGVMEKEQIDQELKSGSQITTDEKWHIAYIFSAAIAVFSSRSEADKANELSDENSDISKEYKVATTAAKRIALKKRYDSNTSKISSYQENVRLYDLITVAIVSLELYHAFYYKRDSEPEPATTQPITFRVAPNIASQQMYFSFNWKW